MSTPISIMWWRKVFVRYGQGCLIFMTLLLVIGFGWNQFGGRGGGGGGPQTNPDKVIMKVNGQTITQQQFVQVASKAREGAPGPQFANLQGSILMSLVQTAVIDQLAKQRGVKADPADIDRYMDAMREQAGMKNASDTDWENDLVQRTGMTLSEYRQMLANQPQILVPALLQSYKADEHVTDQDVKNQNQEVKLDIVLIPVGTSPFSPPQKGKKLLTDTEAKAKADALLKQAQAGADIQAIARANSADFTAKKGGVTDFQSEYKSISGMPATMGVLNFGKDFDDAVHSTPTGQFTPVVKASGFRNGYVFAKVLDRKQNTPKDFDPRKALDELKTQRAQEKLRQDVEARIKAADVQVLDPDKKAYYDYAKLTQMPQEIQMAQLTGQSGNMPSTADYQKQQALVDSEFEAMLKRHPDDATAAMIVADEIKTRKMYATGTTPAQRDAYRDQLISLYTNVLKTTEDRNIRFALADLYKEKKDYAKADEQYAKIAKYLGESPPYDLQTYQEYQNYYRTLQTDFAAISQPKEAADMQQQVAKLQAKIIEEQAKQKAAQAAQEQAAKSAAAAAANGKGGSAAASGPATGATTSTPATQNGAAAPAQGKATSTPAPQSSAPASPKR